MSTAIVLSMSSSRRMNYDRPTSATTITTRKQRQHVTNSSQKIAVSSHLSIIAATSKKKTMILQKSIIICCFSSLVVLLGLLQFCHAVSHSRNDHHQHGRQYYYHHHHVSDDGDVNFFLAQPLLTTTTAVINSQRNYSDSDETLFVQPNNNEAAVVNQKSTNSLHHPSNYRSLQQTSSSSPMAGSCISSTLSPGQQLTKGSYLCYPPPPPSSSSSSTNYIPQYEFGITTTNQIALYTHLPNNNNNKYQLVWTATPPTSIFSTNGIQYMRMQGALGSLAGYNPNRRKIYDSHDDGGKYSSFAMGYLDKDDNVVVGNDNVVESYYENHVVREKEMGSRLEVREDGVFILNEGGDVTFQILIPPSLKDEVLSDSSSSSSSSGGGGGGGSGTIQGFIWNDSATNDGVFGAGDKAISSGVDVTLLECDTDKVVKSVTSGSDGTFVMDGLISGRYKVHVATPPSIGNGGEYKFVTQNVNDGNSAAVGQDSDVNQDGMSNCMVLNNTGANGGKITHLVYVGMKEDYPISVSGRVFHDHNGDGLFDAAATSTSVSNVVVDLYDCVNPNNWIAVTRTDASGNYKFTVSDSSAGTTTTTTTTTTTDLSSLLEQRGVTKFRAVFSGLPNGYTFSPKSVDSDVTTVDGKTPCFDVESNGGTITAINWNAGIMPPQTGKPTMKPTSKVTEALVTIGGYAFLDLDNNGIRSPNFQEEVDIADISVRLFSGCNPSSGNDGTFFSAARTDAQGLYKFVNIPSGSYKMLATAPEGFEFSSTWTNANAEVDNAFNPETGSTKCFTLTDGKTDLSFGMGLRDTTPVVISGMVFDDANNNGFFEEGESPMSDVSVALFDCNGNIKMLDSTDANGMYGFSDLTAGSYLLKFSAPEGYRMSSTWTGLIDNEGKTIAPNADSNVNPETDSSVCKSYKAGEEEYSLDAGMSSSAADTTLVADAMTGKPSAKPTNDLKGDGTPCSGGRCDTEGMCRNKAGLCGIGLAFCNADSVWTKNCPEGGSAVPNDTTSALPTTSLRPTAKPTLSLAPTASPKPTISFCHDDGSVGEVSGLNSEVSTVNFEYSIESEAFTPSSTATLIDLFEKELNRHVACKYADNPCLKCDSAAKTRALRSTKNSTMIGLSPFPKDEITLRECSPPSSKCKVMKGVMTSYYPQGTEASVLLREQEGLLASIDTVINTEDWIGMKVSLEDTPPALLPPGKPKLDSPPSSDGGMSGGAIAGIVIALLAVFAVAAFGVIRIRRIRDEEDEVYFKQLQEHMMHDKSIPFGHADLNGGDDDEDDSDDSSYDSDDDSSSHPSRSAISGDTFPTNIAQATPQDIEDSESSSESETSESEDNLEDDAGEEVEVQMNQEGIEQLKYSGGSDDAPPIYENYDRMSSEEIAAAAEYDDNLRDQNYPYGMIPSRQNVGEDIGADDATAAGSVNSADPPGQSYRDLPEDWEPALPPSAMDYGPGGERFPFEEAGFPAVYDNDPLSESDSDHGSYRSGHSNKSYHSNHSRHSNRSHRSNHSGSQRSNRSYHSHLSQGSRNSQGSHHSGRSNAGSHYSRHSNPDQQEVSGNSGSYNTKSVHNESFVSQNSYHSNHSGSGSDRSYHEEYDQYGTTNSFQQSHPRYEDQQYNMSQQEQAYAAANASYQQQGRFNDKNASYGYGNASSPPEGAAAFYRGGRGEFDEASYHSFDSPPQSHSHQYQPELLDDHVDDVSTFTSATRKASNVSHQEEQEDYEVDDDEESISEIFKSLSAIQTKLASKGKPGGKYARSSRSNNKGIPPPAAPPSQQQQVWDQEGVVEDVSVDGSQFTSMASNQYRNRHPQQGQWMEPVDEHGD